MKLYIDPGTGSMLFTVLLGLIGAAVYSLRMLFIKLLTHRAAMFSDVRTYWSPEATKRAAGYDLQGKALGILQTGGTDGQWPPAGRCGHRPLHWKI